MDDWMKREFQFDKRVQASIDKYREVRPIEVSHNRTNKSIYLFLCMLVFGVEVTSLHHLILHISSTPRRLEAS